MNNSEGRLGEFERHLTGGFEHGKLMFLENSDPSIGTELVMFFMDVEYDPVRVTFDPEGMASIHSDGHKWHMLSADQLMMLSDMCEEAVRMWEKWDEEHQDDG
ncbi:hypothetical protein HYQ43_17275 [Paracoccus pantotrophus]|uniref:Uncharacterized protein n=1 Tax=Paracoccus pantotrophus TaxID=82367 RepID=A0A7H9BXH1_PARPN|nr:hypothetical protein [Paracoccus pantotrophus]QLH15883.1 hypothetical protein HYQ43_17275 [Paracoccus pantotrophus]